MSYSTRPSKIGLVSASGNAAKPKTFAQLVGNFAKAQKSKETRKTNKQNKR